VTFVAASRAPNSPSEESPTVTSPLVGRTHAKDEGLPLYLISSQSVDWPGETERIIRCWDTWVLSISTGGGKHPPHADASWE
jgi:hypothetical protein